MMLERVEWSDSAAPVGMCCRPPLALSSIFIFHGADLAVDELEAAPGIGDLFAQAGGELGEEVAVFACGGFGVEVQLGDLAWRAACAARHRGWRCRARRAGSGA